MIAKDAADLGQHRRGVEPLRIVVMPQHDRQLASPVIEPMPVSGVMGRGRQSRGTAPTSMCDHRPRAILHRNERSSGDRSFRLSAGRQTTTLATVITAVAPFRPVHKSPSLTVAESWLPTAISTVEFASTQNHLIPDTPR
jgi:hypothetical protein